MKIRIYETGNLDLYTVTEMLCQRDKQSNFTPNTRWIESQSEITTEAHSRETGLQKKYMDLYVRWLGVELVIKWLTENQISFEVISYDLLSDEQQALEEQYPDEEFEPEETLLN